MEQVDRFCGYGYRVFWITTSVTGVVGDHPNKPKSLWNCPNEAWKVLLGFVFQVKQNKKWWEAITKDIMFIFSAYIFDDTCTKV